MTAVVTDLDLPEVSDRIAEGPATRNAAAELAARSWLVRTPFGYILTRHDDCIAVLKDKRWHSATAVLAEMRQITDERFLARDRKSILSMEGDEHQRLRRLVSGAFTPRAADRLRPFMREVIDELVDPFASTGRCEFVSDVCEPYPIPIICQLLGAPREDWESFSRWAVSIFKVFDTNVNDHVDEIIDVRPRENRPRWPARRRGSSKGRSPVGASDPSVRRIGS